MGDPARGLVGSEANGEIEGQHHLQLDLLCALRRAVESGAGGAELAEIADTLTAFSKMHFASEELLMRLNAYDGYEGHCEAHARAIERMDALCGRARDGTARWTVAEVEAVEHAILMHIETGDRAFADFLAGRGSMV